MAALSGSSRRPRVARASSSSCRWPKSPRRPQRGRCAPHAGSRRGVTDADRLDRQVWLVASVVVIGVIMSILDTTIVNVALETLSRELHASLSTIQWVSTGYLLSLAMVIPLGQEPLDVAEDARRRLPAGDP